MDLKAFIPAENHQFCPIIEVAARKLPEKTSLSFEKCLANMASNHTVVTMQEKNELIGDPM